MASGKVNDVRDTGSRSLSSIIRSNALTPFNALIGTLWVAMMIVAPWQDALFGFVIVFNTLIGTIQEYRSARTLAKLSLLSEARPTVIRDGREVQISLRELVIDDLVLISTGDQIAVDGDVLQAAGCEIDESLLTGEADPVPKSTGDELLSARSSFRDRRYRVTRGQQSFAGRLTAGATVPDHHLGTARFHQPLHPLRQLRADPSRALLTYSQLRADQSLPDAIRGAIAGVVTMVPEGLVLLTSIAMAVRGPATGPAQRTRAGHAGR